MVPDLKRIMISLPESLLAEVDGVVSRENKNRSEFIREAMKLYLAERKKRNLREQMKKGYLEMGQINLALAQEGFAAENEVVRYYDRKLAE